MITKIAENNNKQDSQIIMRLLLSCRKIKAKQDYMLPNINYGKYK